MYAKKQFNASREVSETRQYHTFSVYVRRNKTKNKITKYCPSKNTPPKPQEPGDRNNLRGIQQVPCVSPSSPASEGAEVVETRHVELSQICITNLE